MIKSLEKDYTFKVILIPKCFSGQVIQQFNQIFNASKLKTKSLENYSEMLKSENTFEIYEGLTGLNNIISDLTENVILESKFQVLCKSNTLQYIIHIIEYNKIQIILHEALQILVCLTNGSIEIIDQIIENGSINCIIQKFSSRDYDDLIIELVSRIFYNVINNSIKNKDYMVKLGTLTMLNNQAIERVKEFQNHHLIEQLTQSIFRYIRFTSTPLKVKQLDIIQLDILVSMQIFKKWIQQNLSLRVLQCICWSFALYLNSYPTEIHIFIGFGILPRMIELMELENEKILFASAKILNIILKSHQNHQEYLIEIGLFQCLGRLIQKQQQPRLNLMLILSIFQVISLSEYLGSWLLNNIELNLKNIYVQNPVNEIIQNLLEAHKDTQSTNLIWNKNIIHLCKIFVSQKIKRKRYSNLYEIIYNLCETYLKDERFYQFNEEIIELKNQITQKTIIIQ